jgi:hypothetical protein
MFKKIKKNKKDIPAITWVDHNDVDDWIDNNLQNMFRPTSSSSQKKNSDELNYQMSKVTSNDELLFNAARNGDYMKVIDIISHIIALLCTYQRLFHLCEGDRHVV